MSGHVRALLLAPRLLPAARAAPAHLLARQASRRFSTVPQKLTFLPPSSRLLSPLTSPAIPSRLPRPFSQHSSSQRNGYSQLVHEHFTAPRNVGLLDKNDPNVGTAVVGKAACGDVIKLQVKIGEDDRIVDVKFKAFGCGSAIASSSYASELIKGKSVQEALAIKNSDISESLSLPPVKVHCSLLAEDAIKLAIKNWEKKRSTIKSNADRSDPTPSTTNDTS